MSKHKRAGSIVPACRIATSHRTNKHRGRGTLTATRCRGKTRAVSAFVHREGKVESAIGRSAELPSGPRRPLEPPSLADKPWSCERASLSPRHTTAKSSLEEPAGRNLDNCSRHCRKLHHQPKETSSNSPSSSTRQPSWPPVWKDAS